MKRFNKTELASRNDNEQQYYKVDISKHRRNHLNTEEAKIKLGNRRKKLDRENQATMDIFLQLMSGEGAE